VPSGRAAVGFVADLQKPLHHMCTVSIIGLTQPGSRGRSLAAGFRLITNRDELRTRPLATAPRWHDRAMFVVGRTDADAAALFPVDPAGGGTWVGAAPSGIVLCLLNANPVPAPELPPRHKLISRGIIIPRLLAEHAANPGGLDDVMDSLRSIELPRFAPFRLVAVAATAGADGAAFRVSEAKWDLRRLECEDHPPGPACFVSSALGDPLVKPRLSLFDAMVRGASDQPGQAQSLAQDRFHRHTWPASPEISVLMSRPDARTVSVTTVEVCLLPGQATRPLVSMRYEPIPEPQAVTMPATPALALRRSPN
jgi:hypothetical protein